MLRALSGWMERPEHPLLGPNIRFLTLVGFWPLRLSRAAGLAFNALGVATPVFVAMQFAGVPALWPDLELVMDSLSLSTVSFMAVVKLVSFRANRSTWSALINAIGKIECVQLSLDCGDGAGRLGHYRKRARIVTYGFMFVAVCTIGMVILSPLTLYLSSAEHRECLRNGSIPYQTIFKPWFPVDVSRPPAYWFAIAVEATIGFYGATMLAVWDTLAVSVMIFFAGQFRLLRDECTDVFGGEESAVSDDEARRRIVSCYRHHMFLLESSKVFNSLISPVMFVYFVVCSMMLCAVMVQLTTGVEAVKLLWTLEYLGACMMQLFLFYWHSNEVYLESGNSEEGAWRCRWYGRGARGRDVLLLGVGLRRRVILTAGPFNDMTIATFLAILKVSYSYFTLLRSTEV